MSYILNKPFTEKQRCDFIVNYNHKKGLTIQETDTALYALEAWEKLDGDEVLDNTQEYEQEQAEKNKNYLIEEVNYPLKAKVAYTGVRFDYEGQELVFETNETSISMINFTAMMAQQSGLSNISNWKCRKTIEPFEPVSITFTTEQFQKLIAFASQMVLQAFAVEEQINQKIQALSVEQLNNPLVLQKTKQQMELAYNNVPVKLEDLFANS